jgi:hypothetical protein
MGEYLWEGRVNEEMKVREDGCWVSHTYIHKTEQWILLPLL